MKACPRRRLVFLVVLLAFAGLAGSIQAAANPPASPGAPVDLLLRGGRVIDGTGNPWFKADVAIRGDRIVAIGRLDGRKAKRVLDVGGLVVAPGFIDMLGQSEYTVLVDPQVLSKTTQGITTELTGEGGSVGPMSDYSRGEAQAQTRDLGIT
ncbi:MAG TPA: D-aminoacylase, partial [Candidatus Polarisedimenticolia bacterium]|nr:D-aminoacylase [Candidatus Polarisedimenticolia bacterium]